MKKLLALLLAVLMVVALFAGCAPKVEDPAVDEPPKDDPKDEPAKEEPKEEPTGETVDTITIGAIYPLSGGSAFNGQTQLEGAQAYADYVNENGGIKSLGGAKIEIVSADTQGDAETGVTELERLISGNDLAGIVGPYNSGVGSATAPIAEKYGIPYILTNCTVDAALYGADYVFRANHFNTANARAFFTFVNDINENYPDYPIEKSMFVVQNTDYGITMMDVVEAEFEDATGTELLPTNYYELNTADYSAIFNKVRASGADTVFICADAADALIFMNQWYEYEMTDLNLVSFGLGMLTADFVRDAGEKAENIPMLNGWCPDVVNAKSGETAAYFQQFAADYQERTGTAMTESVANGWLGCAVLVDAIERAGTTDGEAVRDALKETKIEADSMVCGFHAYGIEFTSMDGMNNQNKNAVCLVNQIIDGEWRFVSPFESAGDANPIIWPQWNEDGTLNKG